MRRFTVMTAAAVVTALLVALTAGSAGAGVAAKNTKFCKAIATAGSDVSSGSSSGVDQSNLKSISATLKKAANSAPGKVKSALKSLASKYAALANAKGKVDQAKAATQLLTDSSYRKSLQTFITYYTKTCAPTSVPTT
jgi:hypothetical protein